jgi:hypothetical protein
MHPPRNEKAAGSGRVAAPRPRFVKRPLPLYLLGPRDLALAFAHRWWHHARDGVLLPSRAAIDTPSFRLLVPDAAWLPVQGETPESWTLGPLEPLLSPLPTPELQLAAAGLRGDLAAAAIAGTPLLQHLEIAGPQGVELWRELVLPGAEDGRRVRELMVLLRPVRARSALRPPPDRHPTMQRRWRLGHRLARPRPLRQQHGTG